MKYRLLKDIGYIRTGTTVDWIDDVTLNLRELIKQGYIEEIQEPIWTDRDLKVKE